MYMYVCVCVYIYIYIYIYILYARYVMEYGRKLRDRDEDSFGSFENEGYEEGAELWVEVEEEDESDEEEWGLDFVSGGVDYFDYMD